MLADFAQSLELWVTNSGKEGKTRMFSASTRRFSVICSKFHNLFDDAKHKLEYKMRLVYTHFQSASTSHQRWQDFETRIYIGEKIMHTVNTLP